MLEDDPSDVLRKAMTGRGIAVDRLAAECGLSPQAVGAMLDGEFCESVARACAGPLGLDPERMARLPDYHPAPVELPGLRQLELPFGGWSVNAWWLEHEGVRLLFDAGLDPDDLFNALPGLPDAMFLTHAHRDHTGGLPRLLEAGVPCHGPGAGGLLPVVAGAVVAVGAIEVRAHDLSGHAMPMFGYHLSGFGRPLLVVGDALFAGSMGKCPDPERYRHALGRLHAVLDVLPDETVLLPGHGPATTLGEERTSNPFL